MTRSSPALLILAASLASLGMARPLHAEEAAAKTSVEEVEVRLKTGESVHGTLVQVDRGQRVIVIIAGKESVIPWEDIAQVVDGSKGSEIVAAPGPRAPRASEPPERPTRGMPRLRIESNFPQTELYRSDGEIGAQASPFSREPDAAGLMSKFVCKAPCERLVDGRDGHRFFFVAPGMRSSPYFRLDEADGAVTARVHGGDEGHPTAGAVLTAFGGTSMLGGGMLLGFHYGVCGAASADAECPAMGAVMGWSLLGAGAAMLAGGLVLLSTRGTTRVELVKPTASRTGVVLENGALRF